MATSGLSKASATFSKDLKSYAIDHSNYTAGFTSHAVDNSFPRNGSIQAIEDHKPVTIAKKTRKYYCSDRISTPTLLVSNSGWESQYDSKKLISIHDDGSSRAKNQKMRMLKRLEASQCKS